MPHRTVVSDVIPHKVETPTVEATLLSLYFSDKREKENENHGWTQITESFSG